MSYNGNNFRFGSSYLFLCTLNITHSKKHCTCPNESEVCVSACVCSHASKLKWFSSWPKVQSKSKPTIMDVKNFIRKIKVMQREFCGHLIYSICVCVCVSWKFSSKQNIYVKMVQKESNTNLSGFDACIFNLSFLYWQNLFRSIDFLGGTFSYACKALDVQCGNLKNPRNMCTKRALRRHTIIANVSKMKKKNY